MTSVPSHRQRLSGNSAALITVLVAFAGASSPGSAAPPPLSEDQITALETVADNKPIADDAGLAALLNHTAGWTVDPWTDDNHLTTSFEFVVENPAQNRGQFMIIRGTKPVRVAEIALGYEYLEAWQVGPTRSEPNALLLIDTRPGKTPVRTDILVVDLPARFFKTIAIKDPIPDAADPDAAIEIPVFVGAYGRFTHPIVISGTEIAKLVALPTMVIVLLAFWFMWIVRRNRTEHLTIPQVKYQLSPEEELNLPEDPVDALAELRRRADNETNHATE